MNCWNRKVTSIFYQAACTAAVATTLSLPGGMAAGQALDDGSKARVNLSSKLAMLGATVGGAGCRISAGIDAEAAQQVLADAKVEVNSILNGLMNGDRALGIPTAERRSRVIRSIDALSADWQQMSDAIDSILAGTDVEGSNTLINGLAASYADKATILASEIQASYTNPNELLFVDAIAIQMAGRQRDLAQQIAKQACEIHQGVDGAGEEISATMALFEKTLAALRDGLPAVGVRPPPNEPVANRLADSVSAWDRQKASAEEFTSTGTISATTVATMADTSELLRREMNDLVILYVLSTPGRDDAILDLLAEMAETELNAWVQDPALVAAVHEQNARHEGLAQADIDALDLQWRAEAEGEGGPLIDDVMAREVSKTLREKQVATAGFINEIFVMDNHGLNVAQSAVTSDYWQGDEDKWQLSYGGDDGAGAVHIGEVEYDDSTGVFQSQVSIPVMDLDTGAVIGAITFGVNVQTLL